MTSHSSILATHSQQWEMLQRARSRGRLPHTLLFVGPPGVGKQTFALRFCQSLMCQNTTEENSEPCGECASCRQIVSSNHPDLHQIRLPDGKHELPIDLFIGPPERRGKEGLCHDLSLSPAASDYRVGLINDALALNEASANSLLKTLEEPPSYAIIILLCDDIEQILPTIRSRCQTIWFLPLENQAIAEISQQQGWSDQTKTIPILAERFQGNLDLIRNSLTGEVSEPVSTECFYRFPFPVSAVQATWDESLKSVAGTSAQRELCLQWLVTGLRIWKECFRCYSQSQASSDPQIQKLLDSLAGYSDAGDLIAQMLERLWRAEEQLNRHLNAGLVMTSFADEIGWLQRQMHSGKR